MSESSIRDRLSTLSRRELIGLVVIVAVTLVGGGVWYMRSLPKPVQVTSSLGAPVAPIAGGGANPVAGPSVSPASLFVDVAGWVRRPGVYEFHDGDRVIDAIQAAGGERGGAALEGLNLAAPLSDGTQILVPKQAPAGTGLPAGSSGPAAAGSSGAPTAKINVNTADAGQLDELPGIGEVLSQAIVDYRTKNGPFGSVDELEDVSGIGPATLEDIRALVTV